MVWFARDAGGRGRPGLGGCQGRGVCSGSVRRLLVADAPTSAVSRAASNSTLSSAPAAKFFWFWWYFLLTLWYFTTLGAPPVEMRGSKAPRMDGLAPDCAVAS